MFCQNCGKEIPDNAKYCPLCGQPVNAETTISNEQTSIKTNQINKERSNFALLGFILSIVSIFMSWHGLLPLGAIGLSVIGLSECKREQRPGKGLAIWGIVISILAIAIRYLFLMAIYTHFNEFFYAIMHSFY